MHVAMLMSEATQSLKAAEYVQCAGEAPNKLRLGHYARYDTSMIAHSRIVGQWSDVADMFYVYVTLILSLFIHTLAYLRRGRPCVLFTPHVASRT
jgi:hypothetical protein